jgi:neutral ceramidase
MSFKNTAIALTLLLSFISPTSFSSNTQCTSNTTFNIGHGIYDITGPAAERGMMGYAQLSQKTSGILQRDWARAFIIQSPCNGKQIVFVNADLAMLFQGTQQEVLKQLKQRYGNEYNSNNVILTAIHQHSGPGGYATHALYNLTTLGFDRRNFMAISNGIVKAIARARANLQPSTILINQGQLTNASANRSPTAYLLDPAAERQRYKHNVDTTMTLIRFNNQAGKPFGLINWFPVHGTSLDNQNTLISGDNKGYAAYLFEKKFHSQHGPNAFVAAFAQANAGDVSPNFHGKPGGHGAKGRHDVEKIGGRQYREAQRIFNSAKEKLVGGVDYRQQYVDMRDEAVNPAFSFTRKAATTCPAAIGVSMMAGTTDGPGYGHQGVTNCAQIKGFLPSFACRTATIKTVCQGVKPIALQTNIQQPPWTVTVLPFSIVTIGDLAIVVNPFELTTMSGRRVRNMVAAKLKPLGIKYVVISGYANGYGGYVTTPQEYRAQRYEGASDLFGPHSLNAQLQTYSRLATALVKHQPAPKSATPPNTLAWPQTDLQTGVVFDAPPIGKHYGDLALAANKHYQPGQTVVVKFYGGNPKNNYRTMGTFLKVQQKTAKGWQTIANDNDWDTTYHWQRDGIAASIITIDWRIPKQQAAGTYRIVHDGNTKAISGKISSYQGVSNDFKIKG